MRRRKGALSRRGMAAGVAMCAIVITVAVTLALRGGNGDYEGDASSPCGAHPFAHVYHRQRLKVLDKCRTVTGAIENIKREPDGDLHIRLKVDDASLLNQKNLDAQHGDLVLEPVCEHEVTQEDAKDACASYTGDVTAPPVGTRVTVTGPWVLDKEHGWNEIHPVVSMAPVP